MLFDIFASALFIAQLAGQATQEDLVVSWQAIVVASLNCLLIMWWYESASSSLACSMDDSKPKCCCSCCSQDGEFCPAPTFSCCCGETENRELEKAATMASGVAKTWLERIHVAKDAKLKLCASAKKSDLNWRTALSLLNPMKVHVFG